MKRLADFDLSATPTVNAATIATLAGGAYLDAGDPVVLLGDSGTGRSHLLVGLGIAACEQGRRVRYVTCAQLVDELVEAADDRRLSRIVARYGRLIFSVSTSSATCSSTSGARSCCSVVTEREEKASIATGSNLPFSEWGRSFGTHWPPVGSPAPTS